MSSNPTQHISLEGFLKTASTGLTTGPTKPRRLTKKERRDQAWKRITQLHIEDLERKQKVNY